MSVISCLKACAGYRPAAAVLLALALAAPVAAAEDERFNVHGFGTLGAVRTTTDDVQFVRDLSQPEGADTNWNPRTDSVLGLQAAWQVLPEWQLVVQGVSRYRFDRTFQPELAWAFVKYEPMPNLSLRAGRLGTEFFMLADSRWVGYSFLTVRPPGDFFWYLPFYSIHGADAALSLPVGEHVLRGKVFYGLSQGKIPLATAQWNIEDSPMMGGYLEYQAGAWQVRASYSNIRFERDLPLPELMPGIGAADLEFLSTRNTRTHYYSLAAVYDNGPWQAQLMFNHIEQGSKALESSDGGYALLGYRLGKVTPYLGYSYVHSKKDVNPTTPVSTFVVQDSHSAQKTTFAGARWDFARNMALKIQWDGIRGDPTSLFPYRNDDRANWSGRMNVYSATLDFVF